MEIRLANADNEQVKPSLIFDADAITLTGRFNDELSAFRAKRSWNEALSSYFLLETKRDFQMKVDFDEKEHNYMLRCAFHSACGRYAFWRLVNHQAPEVEAKLYTTDMTSKKSARFLLGSIWNALPQTPWVYSAETAVETLERETASTKNVILSLLRFFNRDKPSR